VGSDDSGEAGFFWCGKRGPRPTSSTSQQRISPNFATTHESIYILHSKHIERDFQKFATKTSKLKHVKHVKQAPYCDHFTAHCTAEMFIPPCSEGTGSFSHLVSFFCTTYTASNVPILQFYAFCLFFPFNLGRKNMRHWWWRPLCGRCCRYAVAASSKINLTGEFFTREEISVTFLVRQKHHLNIPVGGAPVGISQRCMFSTLEKL